MRNCVLLLIASLVMIACGTNKNAGGNSSRKNEPIQQVRVLSYNIHHANPPSKPDFIDLAAIANVIKQQAPDLVALQEVDVHTGRSGTTINQAEEIARLTGMHYFFGHAIDYGGGEYGVAILSKYPMENKNNLQLPSAEGSGGEPRTLAYATIQLPGNKKLVFACTHLDVQRSDSNRLMQVERIAQVLGQQNAPVIIAGDLNAMAGSRTINTLDKYFTRTCTGDCPFTIPVEKPTRTIDFIAFRPTSAFTVLDHKVIDEKYASDHLPVTAALKIN